MESPNTREKCSECEGEESFLQKEASFFTYITSFLAFLTFGFLAIFIIPLIVESSKSIVKRCADCYCVLEERELFSLPSLKDEILDIRLGKCSFVISRKYAIVIITLFTVFYFFRYFTAQDHRKPDWIPTQSVHKSDYSIWPEYLRDCGEKVYLSNSLKANKKFKEKYQDQIVTWHGYFIALENTILDYEYQYLLTVKMKPTESKPNIPDIYLKFNDNLYNKYSEKILSRVLGSEMIYKAKYLAIGDEFKAHEFEMLGIEFLDNVVNLNDIPVFEPEEKPTHLRKEIP